MQRMYHFINLIIVMSIFGCAGQLPLIGLDEEGNPIASRVDESKYIKHLSRGLISLQESVVPALERATETEANWKLRTVMVGFGLKAEAGFGPFKVGVAPRIRGAFTNLNGNPAMP